ncbi:YncE family protein [Streptomyces sp. YU58]|uniref:YncE family protein n=1 Tax=Streptomyces sp. SX92 TaxID=3158972 RepID=UPI0027B94556|nr:WD40 repeat domain-containing protein [Streptomyces coralus]WLW55957.1 WD40 repeat domain-containing protein [Streptomyces coralus]
MNVEELLTETLREQAADQAPAGPGFADRVLAVRRRRRARGFASVAAATAAVVAVAVAVPLLDSGKDDVRPAGIVGRDGTHAHPDQSPPRDMIAAGRSVLAAYYTGKPVMRTKEEGKEKTEEEGSTVRTYWLLDPRTGRYAKDTRWSYVAVAPGARTAAVLERNLPAHRIGLLDLATGEVERWIPVQRGVGGLAFSGDGGRLVATTYAGNPDVLVRATNAGTGEAGWMAPNRSSRTGFLLVDLAGGGSSWSKVSHGREVLGRADFAFTRDDRLLFAQVVGPKDGLERFYDLSGAQVAAPADEKHLRWDVPARLSPNGRLAALGLTKEVDGSPGRSYSSIRDSRTGREIAMVRGGQLLAWADDKRLIAWERVTGLNEGYHDRLVLVTIGSEKPVPLSGTRMFDEDPETLEWQPVFVSR